MSWAAITTSPAGVSGPAALTFEKETVSGRIYASVIRGSALQFFILLAFSTIQSFAPLTPISWMLFNLNVIFHPSSWFFDALIVASIVAMGVVFARGYRLTASPARGFVSVIRDLFRPEVVLSLTGHVAAGMVLARSYLGLVGQRHYSSLTLLCAELGQDRCINEAHVFVVVSGGFSGLCLWLDYHLRNGAVLQFRAIQQLGMEYVRGEFSRMLKDALYQVLLNLRWFYLLYLVFGGRLERFLGDVLHMDLYSQGSSLSMAETAWKHLGTFGQCLAVDTLIHLSLNILHLVINISLTRRVKFAMRSVTFVGPGEAAASAASGGGLSSVALLDAIDPQNNHDLMKYLAYQDFACLAENSALRRLDFFTLSQPGGHARNWADLLKKVMGLIKDFANDLNEASKQAATVIPSAAEVAKATAKAAGGGQGGHPPSAAAAAKAIQSRMDSKAMAISNNNKKQDSPCDPPDQKKAGLLGAWTLGSAKAVTDKLISVFGSAFAGSGSSSTPDAAVRAVYARAMPVIWAIKGMSHLITHSISEDRYGVVQKDLAMILVELLSLLQTLERHKGLTATARKNRFETRDLQLKQDLRVTLKSSLYRITVTFGDHLNALDLPAEHKNRLANYHSFKEG